MADTRKNDGLFHWNFDLNDNDSEFSEITYSPKTTMDIDPNDEINIFVPKNGTEPRKPAPKNPRSDASSFVDRYVNEKAKTSQSVTENRTARNRSTDEELMSSLGTAKRTQTSSASSVNRTAARSSSQRKPVKKKKKTAVNYRLIAMIAGALILVVLLALLLSKCGKDPNPAESSTGKKNNKKEVWTELNDPTNEVYTLMNSYFETRLSGDAQQMRRILDTNARVNATTMGMEANIYEDFKIKEIYTTPGIKEGEYAIFCTFDAKFYNIQTAAPCSSCFYAKPDTNGKLRLMTSAEFGEKNTDGSFGEVYTFLAEKCADSSLIEEVQAKVNADHEAAVKSDTVLNEYWNKLQSGQYELPPKPADPAGPTDPTNPGTPSSAATPDTEDTNQYAYVKGFDIRMRSGSNTDSEVVLSGLQNGHCMIILGEENGWYKVSDTASINKATGQSQTISGKIGYIRKDLMSMDFPG